MSAVDGEVLWQTRIAPVRMGWEWMAPHGSALLMSSRSDGVLALEGSTGQEKWSLPNPEPTDYTENIEHHAAGGYIYAIGSRMVEAPIPQSDGSVVNGWKSIDGEVRTVSAATGHSQWTRTLPPLGSSLANGSFLYLVSGDLLLALHSHSGATAWSVPLQGPEVHLMVHDGLLLVILPVPDKGDRYPILGLDPKTGEERWRLGMEHPTHPPTAGPPGMALLTTIHQSAKLIAVDTSVGEVIWSTPVKKDVALIAGGDLVYTYDGHIAAYDISTGNSLSG